MPLKGRLILDCSMLLPGPFLGKLMANLGARVIKIENPKIPDRARSMGAFYQDLNEMKELVFLDLTHPQDRSQFEKLVQKADGLIEGFRPETKIKLGLNFSTLHSVNPKLCIASLVGYPEDGPWKERAGHDLNFAAVTGCLSLFEGMPGLPLADLFAAYEGALRLTAALDSVARGAKGTRIVISMSETLKKVQSSLIRDYQEHGNLPKPGETLFSGKYPCYRIYTTSEGRRIAVGAIERKFWEKLCRLLKVPHLIEDGYAEGERGKQVITELQSVFGSKTWQEWSSLLEPADCCVEPILDYSEVYLSGLQP